MQAPARVLALIVFLLSVWTAGVVTSVTFGGWIHVLLLIALDAVLLRIMLGEEQHS